MRKLLKENTLWWGVGVEVAATGEFRWLWVTPEGEVLPWVETVRVQNGCTNPEKAGCRDFRM
jgi:hypothetical protein